MPNGRAMSPRRQNTVECARTQRGENLHVSLTGRRGRVRGPHIDLRGGRVEVVGTRAGQNLLLCIQESCRKSPRRPQIPDSVDVTPGSSRNVSNRTDRTFPPGRYTGPPFLTILT